MLSLFRFIADKADIVAKIFVDSREFQPRILLGFGLEHFALFRSDFKQDRCARLELAFGLLQKLADKVKTVCTAEQG